MKSAKRLPAARLPRREVAVVAALLLLLCSLVYGRYVIDGGFSTDDWSHGAAVRFPAPSGVFDFYWSALSYRPMSAVYLPLTHAVLGEHPALHIAWTLILGNAASFLLCLVLRRAGRRQIHALSIGALLTQSLRGQRFDASGTGCRWLDVVGHRGSDPGTERRSSSTCPANEPRRSVLSRNVAVRSETSTLVRSSADAEPSRDANTSAILPAPRSHLRP